jgi:type IV pilus assembly protein PilQ
MIARRLVISLVLVALVSLGVFARAGIAAAAGEQAFTLTSLKHETVGATTRILIESSAPPLYTVFRPSDRLIIVDLPGGEGSGLAPEYSVKNSLVDSITVRRTGSVSAVTRIEVATRSEVRDRSVLNGNTLVIELMAAGSQSENKTSPGVEVFPAQGNGRAALQPQPVANRTAEPKPERAVAGPSVLRPATLVRAVRSEAMEGAVRIVVETDGSAQFKDFVLNDPWRVVVDVSGVRSAFGNRTTAVGAGSVDRVRVGQPGSNVVRIVLDTKAKVPYRVGREGSSLVITVGDLSASRMGKPVVDAKQQSGQTGASAATASTKQAAQPAAREAGVAGERVENKEQSKTQPEQTTATPSVVAQNRAQNGATESNRSATSQSQTSKPSVKETVTQVVPTQSSYARPVAEQRPTQQNTVNTGGSKSSPSVSTQLSQRGDVAFCDPNYMGGLISFDLRAGVDLRDMLRFISQQYGVNFILDKSVGTVPVDIRVTDIAWNKVMESVLRANRLGAICESEGRIIRIATLAAVKEEEDQKAAIAAAQTQQVPLVTEILRLKYARASAALGAGGSGQSGRGSVGGGTGGSGTGTLLSIIQSRLSSRGKIEQDARTNSLIVTDMAENMKVIKDMITALDRPEPQVEIEARIVIASRNFLRDLGVELASAVTGSKGKTALFETTPVQLVGRGLQQSQGGQGGGGGGGNTGGNTGGGNTGGNNGSSQNTGLGPNLVGPFATEALRSGAANTVLSLTTGALGTGIISTALTASETKGQIRTIASPRVVATDNKTAEIVNGVQIPVQTVSNNTVTTTFVTAALRLEITPQIVEETGEVTLHVVAENNTVNFALAGQFNNGTPGINTQSAESTVRLQDGGTTVMGGINIDTEGHSVNRTPGVSRIPLLGELFKRRSTRRDTDEILFFVTPRIIREDGLTGPRVPHRSSVEGAPNPAGPQRAAGAGQQNKSQVQASAPAGGGK